MMVMLMNRLVETFGQILQDISSLRPLLPRCSPGQNNLRSWSAFTSVYPVLSSCEACAAVLLRNHITTGTFIP